MFGLVAYVILNSQPTLDGKVHWAIAIVVALVAAGGINFFLKPGSTVIEDHH